MAVSVCHPDMGSALCRRLAALMIGLGYKIDKCYRCSNSEAGMSRLQPAMLAIATVPRSVQAAKFCEVLRKRRQISQYQPYCV